MKTNDAVGIRCPRCRRTSWNPVDVHEAYCGECHEFLLDDTAAALMQFTIYERPAGYRDSWLVLARLFYEDTIPAMAGPGWICRSLAEARQVVPEGYHRIERHPEDPPCVMETWI